MQAVVLFCLEFLKKMKEKAKLMPSVPKSEKSSMLQLLDRGQGLVC